MQLRYSRAEILADHPALKPNLFGTKRLHGGFDAEGRYVSPRTLHRWPAIEAWRANFQAKGGELIDASTRLLSAPHYPNLAQMKFLLQHGMSRLLWNMLSFTGIVEGRGRMLTMITAPDFQPLVEDEIGETATAHLNQGLFAAHGLDEGGDGVSPIAAHDQMWFLARDLVLGANAHPVPDVPERAGRPGGEDREMPELPPFHEVLIKQLMNVLMVEIRAERGFAFNLALFRDRELFTDRRDEADAAARIVEQIRQDEAPHVAYLQLFISELRQFRFRTERGTISGSDMIDPVWSCITAWHAENVPRTQAESMRAVVRGMLAERPDGAVLLDQFAALGDRREAA